MQFADWSISTSHDPFALQFLWRKCYGMHQSLTHKEQQYSCEALPTIGFHLECSKQDQRDDDGYCTIQEVPGQVGQPVAGCVNTTHKLKMLGLGRYWTSREMSTEATESYNLN